VGDDRFGAMLREMWRREGVDDRHVRTEPGAPTGLYFVEPSTGGHRFEYRRAGSAASRYRPEDLPLAAIAAAKVLHVSGITLAIGAGPRDAAFAAMAHARAHGVLVSFDPNLRTTLWPLAEARPVIGDALDLADLCLPSWDDAAVLTGLGDGDAVIDALLARGIATVALKLGAEGCVVATRQSRVAVPALRVDALDCTGAGDCFDGAFVTRLLRGDAPEAAARFANTAAALSTLGYGAVDPIPCAAHVWAALPEAELPAP
jgi:2-dehydro-3-deoxygluconokinase